MKSQKVFYWATQHLRVWLLLLSSPAFALGQTHSTRIAILDFGDSPTSVLAEQAMRSMLSSNEAGSASSHFDVLDATLTSSAARGVGYAGSLNMSRAEARDLGAAIGCDFYFLGNAQTVRRSSSAKPIYYESYAAIFLVSARTGRLILWERPSREAKSAEESVKEFAVAFSEERAHYVEAILKASENERTERAVNSGAKDSVIELLTDGDEGKHKDIRAPRPYRRFKPAYPDAAARSLIEATIDVLVDIDARGEVANIEIERWAGYGLDESVISTVKQMHFFPAMRDGVAIPLRVLLRYNFRKPANN
jgi:TonB family protein